MKTARKRTSKELSIWIIEDDPLQAECLSETIDRKLKAAGVSGVSVEIKPMETECEFREGFGQALNAGKLPDAVICDVMLPWAYPGDDGFEDPTPEASAPEAYREAGNRCFALMSESVKSAKVPPVPWLFRTILSSERMKYEQTLAEHKEAADSTFYVSKESGMDEVYLWVDRALFHLEPEDQEQTAEIEDDVKFTADIKEARKEKWEDGFTIPQLRHAYGL